MNSAVIVIDATEEVVKLSVDQTSSGPDQSVEKNVIDAFDVFQKENFLNISVDFMFGLENQTLGSWKSTLSKIIAMKPKHISTYNLTIEQNTKYDQELTKGTLTVPSDDLQAQMLVEEKNILHQN